MNAEHAREGEKFLTKAGIPVTVIRNDGNAVMLRAEPTGNEHKVAKEYPLLPFDPARVNKESKALLKASGKLKGPKAKRPVRQGTLSAAIDPLLNGKHTVKEIVQALKKNVPELVKRATDIAACVRARLWSFKRKGYSVERDAQKRIRVVEHAKRAR